MSSTTSFAYGLSCGALQPTTSYGINCYSSGYFDGNLSVYGTSNLTGIINILRSAPNGGEVTMGITNSGLNGYSALYLQSRLQSDLTRNETGQVYVGGQSMTVQTRTNHPIILKSYADEPLVTVPDSLTISNNATRDVIINTPLTVNNNVTINGFLAAKPYVSLRVVTSGGTPSTGTTVGPPTTIGTPGSMSVTNYGYTTSVTAARGTSGTTNAFYILLHGLHRIHSVQIML